jgi:hypothetical protein
MKKMMLALSMLLCTACATMTHGPNETIAVDSQPRGAAASITCDGGVHVTGTTPAKLVIPRKVDGCVVEVSGNSHTKRITLHRGTSGRYWANFAWFSPIPFGAVADFAGNNDNAFAGAVIGSVALTGIGFIVDSATGSMFDRDVHEIFVDLEH